MPNLAIGGNIGQFLHLLLWHDRNEDYISSSAIVKNVKTNRLNNPWVHTCDKVE